ncbi:MAG TPA: hypothetical protein VF522_12685 [Ramlibacter sp.]|uniref:hypothetical protein n=1 Tax=Ramlibacter sp. TaxID=1917967 RepID=UPI002ED2AC35
MKSLLLSLALCALPGCAVYEPYPYIDPNVAYPVPVVPYDPAYVYAYPPGYAYPYPYPYYEAYWPTFGLTVFDGCCSRGHFHRGHSRHGHSRDGVRDGPSRGGHSFGGHSRR